MKALTENIAMPAMVPGLRVDGVVDRDASGLLSEAVADGVVDTGVVGQTPHMSGQPRRANAPTTSLRSQLAFGNSAPPHSGSSGWLWQLVPSFAYVVVVVVVVAVAVVEDGHTPHMTGQTLRTNDGIVLLCASWCVRSMQYAFVSSVLCPHSGCSSMPWHTPGA